MPKLEKAKVFMTGRSQAVRIPAQYRFKSDEVYIRHDPRTGEITLSERPKQPSLTEIFRCLMTPWPPRDPLSSTVIHAPKQSENGCEQPDPLSARYQHDRVHC